MRRGLVESRTSSDRADLASEVLDRLAHLGPLILQGVDLFLKMGLRRPQRIIQHTGIAAERLDLLDDEVFKLFGWKRWSRTRIQPFFWARMQT